MALITVSEVITYALNNSNFDDNLINDNLIEIAELKHIKPAFGTDFYYDVINDTSSYSTLLSGGTYTDSEGYTKSFQGLKKAVAFFAKYEALPEIMMQIVNTGLQINNSDYSNSLSSGQRAELLNTCLTQATALLDECLEYLKEKISTFTRFAEGTTKIRMGVIIRKK